MALSVLDPNTALIVVDLQKGIMEIPTAHPKAEVVKHAVELLEAFRHKGLPVVLVNVTGGAPGRTEQPRLARSFPEGWADLIPELNQQPGDILVTKQTPGSFSATGLEEKLKQLGVTQVVVVGVATTAGVESTARQAYEAGFNVTLAIDAMTDRSEEAHQHSVTKIFPKIGETGTTDAILELLASQG